MAVSRTALNGRFLYDLYDLFTIYMILLPNKAVVFGEVERISVRSVRTIVSISCTSVLGIAHFRSRLLPLSNYDGWVKMV